MIITSNGYKVPASGDRGGGANGFFSALEYNFNRISAHNHDGVNSEALNTRSIERISTTISKNNWGSLTPRGYSQTIDLPSGMGLDKAQLQFQIAPVGNDYGSVIYPTVDIVSNTRYIVYVNDPTLDLVVYY